MRLAWIAAATMLTVLPAQAGVVADLLGSPGDCFTRVYDAAHLRSHPDQRVAEFRLGFDTAFQDPNYDTTLLFGFETRDGALYTGVGLCDGDRCGVEGDGGAFSITRDGTALRLQIDPRRGMGAEGKVDYVNLADSDDTVFLLYPAPARACRF